MTIDDIMEIFIDRSVQKVYIWDCRTEKEIYRGFGDNIPCELEDMEILSIDNITNEYIGFNIETEE